MNRKRHLQQHNHPFNAYPFEAFAFGSWQPGELIKIDSGIITLQLKENQHVALEKDTNVRIRSRKATLSDCSCFLRPGIDICVLSTSPGSDNSDEVSAKSVWLDAKINSIQRKPHDAECSCQYYVNFYLKQDEPGKERRTLTKEVKVVGINQISILQKLDHNSFCEDQYYRWESSKDCSTVLRGKLFLGIFLRDLSWLLVTSVLKKISFCARSVQNKIVYQILGSHATSSSSDTDFHMRVVNFREEDGILMPIISHVDVSDANRTGQELDSCEDKVSQSYDVEALRRSKRRNVQPQRYLAQDNASDIEIGTVRTGPYKVDRGEHDEKWLPSSARQPGLRKINRAEEVGNNSQRVDKVRSSATCGGRNETKEVHLHEANQNEHQTQPVRVPFSEGDDSPAQVQLPLNDKVTRCNAQKTGENSSNYDHLTNIPQPKKKGADLLNPEPSRVPTKSVGVEMVDDFSSIRYDGYRTRKLQRKSSPGLDDVDFEIRREGINSNEGAGQKRHRSNYSRSRSLDEQEQTYRGKSLNATAYKEMIDSYFDDIDKMLNIEESPLTDQWKETRNLGQKKETKIPQEEDEEEMSEMDRLWREMDMALASSYLDEETEGSNGAIPVETVTESNEKCQHDERLDEEIGIYCLKCGVVSVPIKDITSPFMEPRRSVRHQEEKQDSEKELEPKANEDDKFHNLLNNASPDEVNYMENDNVWSVIPELGKRMHVHQKKAFEFLWENIGGSLEPALMEAESGRRGGCVISHAPGAGKTFLTIAFLVSYLKLFPEKKPLVLAPKTTLYTWYKEFIKWEISMPVYLIHGRRTQNDFNQISTVLPGVPKPPKDVKYVLDCLNKIKKWQTHPSVLVMGYTSFLSLMREDPRFKHKMYMAKALREGPGILILDEGHNPRNTKSRLRKGLMKVKTKLRILLSGTLFQNNFCEYFNTLCLARPKFVHEVLKELDPKYKKKSKLTEKERHLLESQARTLFLDNIAKKIDSTVGEERMQGLSMLRKITNGFIDVYDSGNSDSLPVLQSYTLLMNTTDIQQEILLKLHATMSESSGYPMELELLITLGSIHPWLVLTAATANKFFTSEELQQLEKCKFDLKLGSKVRFVLNLVSRVMEKEKVLIFCHNIAPMKLLIELFEKFFNWKEDREVLLLTGKLDVFERGKVIDEFENPSGASKVLLASITACAEGISLTAASRVIFLDSEWNPSRTKQAIARAYRSGQQKMVHVYQLLVTGTLEEDKYRRTTWKEWVSSMIFDAFVEDPSQCQAEKIEDDILREMIEDDKSKSIHMIMKNEKASTS